MSQYSFNKKWVLILIIVFFFDVFLWIWTSSNYVGNSQVDGWKKESLFLDSFIQYNEGVVSELNNLFNINGVFWWETVSAIDNWEKTYKSIMYFMRTIPAGIPINRSIYIISHFGKRIDPITAQAGFHSGVDLMASLSVPVIATAPGIIVSSDNNKDYGKNVVIQHSFGFQTIYAHLICASRFKQGSYIKLGTTIGYVGNSGRSTGPHLHYEIRKDGLYVNPEEFLELGKNLSLL